MDEDSYGFLDEALLRPPQILGCERSPFIAVIFAATFVTVVGFGITLQGLVGGVMLAAAGVMVLRRIAVHDPFWFAVLFEAARYPRDMPDVLPDRTLPKLAFVGYDDPPSDAAVLLARLSALAIVVLPARGDLGALRPRARARHSGGDGRGDDVHHRALHAPHRTGLTVRKARRK